MKRVRTTQYVLTASEAKLLRDLETNRKTLERLEKKVESEKRRRDVLLVRGVKRGFSTRVLASAAGVSSPTVSNRTRDALGG